MKNSYFYLRYRFENYGLGEITLFCEKCGANIPDDSKFCISCGNAIKNSQKEPLDSSQYVPMAELQQEPEQKKSETEIPAVSTFQNESASLHEKNTGISNNTASTNNNVENNKKSAMLFAMGLGSIFLVAIIFSIMALHKEMNNPTPETQTNATASGSTEPKFENLSPKQKKIRKMLSNGVEYNLDIMLKRDFQLPETAQIKHDRSSWDAENSLFYFSGTITYQNKEGIEETNPFIAKLLMSEKSMVGVYEKLGDKEMRDVQKTVNTYGAILDNSEPDIDLRTLLNGTLYTVNDEEYEKVTLEEFARIKVGMTYGEVTDIIGSLGTFTGQTGANINTYTWVGNGDKSSKATISFTGKKVISTTQEGLK